MKHATFWLVVVLIAGGLQLLGRLTPAAPPATTVVPASVAKIEGTGAARLTLLPEAAKRLDIATAAVRETTIDPKQRVAGEIISTDDHAAIVRVELTANELSQVRQDEPAFVLPLARDSQVPR